MGGMTKRHPRRLAVAAATCAVPLALLGLVPRAGHANVDPDPGPPPPPPPPSAPLIILPDLVAWEKAGPCRPLSPAVWLSHPVATSVTVTFDTADGTAVAPADYTAVRALKVTIPAGQTSAPVPVPIRDDELKEPAEYFTATISSPSAGVIVDGLAVITINDGAQPRPC
jgi:Calx-beta domain